MRVLAAARDPEELDVRGAQLCFFFFPFFFLYGGGGVCLLARRKFLK